MQLHFNLYATHLIYPSLESNIANLRISFHLISKYKSPNALNHNHIGDLRNVIEVFYNKLFAYLTTVPYNIHISDTKTDAKR